MERVSIFVFQCNLYVFNLSMVGYFRIGDGQLVTSSLPVSLAKSFSSSVDTLKKLAGPVEGKHGGNGGRGFDKFR